jgi:hypothetical protein
VPLVARRNSALTTLRATPISHASGAPRSGRYRSALSIAAMKTSAVRSAARLVASELLAPGRRVKAWALNETDWSESFGHTGGR